jgi:hypothetical protein
MTRGLFPYRHCTMSLPLLGDQCVIIRETFSRCGVTVSTVVIGEPAMDPPFQPLVSARPFVRFNRLHRARLCLRVDKSARNTTMPILQDTSRG